MIRSILMGLVAGMRSMTPIAVISWAARRNLPSGHNTPLSILSSPAVSKVTLALAAAELLGDKMRSAPDRIIIPGILARVVTGAIAGAAVAPRRGPAPRRAVGRHGCGRRCLSHFSASKARHS